MTLSSGGVFVFEFIQSNLLAILVQNGAYKLMVLDSIGLSIPSTSYDIKVGRAFLKVRVRLRKAGLTTTSVVGLIELTPRCKYSKPVDQSLWPNPYNDARRTSSIKMYLLNLMCTRLSTAFTVSLWW